MCARVCVCVCVRARNTAFSLKHVVQQVCHNFSDKRQRRDKDWPARGAVPVPVDRLPNIDQTPVSRQSLGKHSSRPSSGSPTDSRPGRFSTVRLFCVSLSNWFGGLVVRCPPQEREIRGSTQAFPRLNCEGYTQVKPQVKL